MQYEVVGKSSRSRERLSKLLQESGDLITVAHAAEVLGVQPLDVAKTLARWAMQGWLTRIQRGVYAAVPIEASAGQVLEDSWVLIPQFFAPAYVGGWSAAEHWDLTEQIFHDVCVLTQKPVARQKIVLHGSPFYLTHISKADFFGTKTIWRKTTKVLVSDIEKTLLDMFAHPPLGGGTPLMVDCFREALKHKDFQVSRLIEYALHLNNGAVFKRLGFVSATLLGVEHALTRTCAAHLTKGNAKFDPGAPADRLITKWRLFVPANLLQALQA